MSIAETDLLTSDNHNNVMDGIHNHSSSTPNQFDGLSFLNALPHAIALLDANKTICITNHAFNQLCECKTQTMNGITLDSLFESNDNYIKFNSDFPKYTGLLWLKQSSGNTIKVVAQLSPFNNTNNISTILSLYSFKNDSLGAHFIAGISNDGCWAWDLVNSTTWRSTRWLEIAGRTHESAELGSNEVSNMFEFINASENRNTLKSKLMEDSGMVEGEGYLRYPDGKRKHMSWQGLVVAKNSSGEPLLTMGSIRDMTPFVARNVSISQARDHVAHQARLLQLGETLATVSHELNQPLSAIASFASVCKRNINPNSENGKIISQIETQALRAGTLLRRIRDFAQKGNHSRAVVSITPILNDVIDWMRTDWRCRDMNFCFSMSPELSQHDLNIYCHRVEIEQVIINLILNAAAAVRSLETPSQQHDSHDISISILPGQQPHTIAVCIADRGPGLSAVVLDSMFTPFITTRIDGLGLGLSISKNIATELGGALEYQSRQDGGALFVFTIPTTQINEAVTDNDDI